MNELGMVLTKEQIKEINDKINTKDILEDDAGNHDEDGSCEDDDQDSF